MDADRERQPDEDSTSAEAPVLGTPMDVGAYVERTEETHLDNDQESHVSPSDNDGETIPQDQVVDNVGG